MRPTIGGQDAQSTERVGAAPPPRFPAAIRRSGQEGQL
jgi:hypothetical protein